MNATQPLPNESAGKPSTRRKKQPAAPTAPETRQTQPLNIDDILAETNAVDGMINTYNQEARMVVLGAKIDKWTEIKSGIRDSAGAITKLEADKTDMQGKVEKLQAAHTKVEETIGKLQKALNEAGEQADKIEGTVQMRAKLSTLQAALPGIQADIQGQKATLAKIDEDIAQMQKNEGELEEALRNPDLDEIRELADSEAKELDALQKEIEGEFPEDVRKLHETSTTAEKTADGLLGQKNALTDRQLLNFADLIKKAEGNWQPVAKSPLIEIIKNGGETTEIDISAKAKQTLDMAVRFGLIAEETAGEILKNLSDFVDGAAEATVIISRAKGKRKQLNDKYAGHLQNSGSPRRQRQQGAKPAESPRGRSRVKSIPTPEEETQQRQARKDRDKKVPLPPKKGDKPTQRPSDTEKAQTTEAETGNPAMTWMDILKDPNKQKDLKTVCEKYIAEQGLVTVAMNDITRGQITEGEVQVPQKGIFRIVMESTPVGVVHVKVDEAGNPTNEVVKIVTLEGLEQGITDVVAQNDIGNKGIFKNIHAQAVKTAGAQAISAKKREQSGDTTPKATEK